MAGKRMAAKFDGRCHVCKGRIARGSAIVWSRATGAAHADCHFADDELDLRPRDPEVARGMAEMREIQAISAPGSAFRDMLYREMEMAAYNRGED